MNLDDLLTQSAPPASTASPELARHVEELVTLTENAVTSRRRRLRRVTVAGCVATLAVGAGGVAAATDLVPFRSAWSSSEGGSCHLQAAADLRPTGEAVPPGVTREEQLAAYSSARQFLSSLDLDSIDRDEAAEHWFAYLHKVSVDHPTRKELEATFRGQDLEVHALLHEVDSELSAHLRAAGHDPRTVMVTIANRCTK